MVGNYVLLEQEMGEYDGLVIDVHVLLFAEIARSSFDVNAHHFACGNILPKMGACAQGALGLLR